MTSIFQGQPPQNKALSNQNKGHQRVPGSYRGEITNYHAINDGVFWSTTCDTLSIDLLGTGNIFAVHRSTHLNVPRFFGSTRRVTRGS